VSVINGDRQAITEAQKSTRQRFFAIRPYLRWRSRENGRAAAPNYCCSAATKKTITTGIVGV
jgi:hypothetical protein